LSVNFEFNEEQLVKLKPGQIFDFKIFREKPLYKVSSNEYCLVNQNFFIDKFFHSLNFPFYNYMHNQKGFKDNYQGFKGKYSQEFSEKTLFFETMDSVLADSEILKVKGTDYDYEYSDYYVRSDNNIYLFEFKDYLINAESKHSYDYELLSNELKAKYIEEHGAKQLINIIHKIENNEIDFDKSKLNFKKLNNYTVYPIIVFTDITLNCTGLNYMFNREFITFRNQEKFQIKVKNLILIDLNTLIEFQEIFINKSLNLLELFKGYLDYVSTKKIARRPLQELTNFSEFIILQIDKLGIERIPPKSFETSLKELFDKNYN
jgi:hypothetical protein